jgi:hypothetical protein
MKIKTGLPRALTAPSQGYTKAYQERGNSLFQHLRLVCVKKILFRLTDHFQKILAH